VNEPKAKFAEGDLVVNRQYAKLADVPTLVVLDRPELNTKTGTFYYGLHYVQRPELGYPNGGSSWSTEEKWLHFPQTGHEQLLAMQYGAHGRVLLTAKAAEAAVIEAKAVDVTLAVFLRSEPS
jgi:hypothetical protein